MIYRVAMKLGDAYGKEKRGYLASSRIRGHWVAKYWPECDDYFYPEEFNQTSEQFFDPQNQLRLLRGYDVVIFNKAYEWRVAKKLKGIGIRIVVDFCDPDFLLSHSSAQRVADCFKILAFTDLAVVNGEPLKKALQKYFKKRIEVIPDRIDLEGLPKKDSYDELRRIIWYGYSENLRVLEPYLKNVIDMGLEITIVSDKIGKPIILNDCKYPPKDRITFKVWHADSVNEQIISHDVVFIGKDLDPYLSQFKSNNRAVLGWALKMPVAWDIEDLKKLQSKKERLKNAIEGNHMVRQKYDVRHSSFSYDTIIRDLLRDGKGSEL